MSETEIRALMSAVDPPPSRVDVHQAVSDGRRDERRRQFASAGGLAAIVALVIAAPLVVSTVHARAQQVGAAPPGPSALPVAPSTGPASARPTAPPSATGQPSYGGRAPVTNGCAVRVLPVPPGLSNVEVTAVDPTGRYVGGHATKGQNFIPILWTDGKAQILVVGGAGSADISAINAAGTVVGLAAIGSQEWVFEYHQRTLTRLRTPAGYPHVFPEPAINARGDIVINAEPGSREATNMITLIWPSGSTSARRLPLPTNANLFGIADDGTLVGGTYPGGYAQSAMAWTQTGQGRVLSTVDGRRAVAFAVRGQYAAGVLYGADNDNSPALWNVRTGQLVQQWADQDMATAVNAAGWVVFESGAVVHNGLQVPLDTVDTSASRAVAISDTNLAVGEAMTGSGAQVTRTPVTWQC